MVRAERQGIGLAGSSDGGDKVGRKKGRGVVGYDRNGATQRVYEYGMCSEVGVGVDRSSDTTEVRTSE